jgi:hypothetical protein
MKIFKSTHHRRIEAKIKSLTIELDSIVEEKSGTNQTRNTHDYCKLIIKEHELKERIELLNSLL